MDTLITPSNIVFAMGIIGTIFGIYKMLHDPQVTLDKQQDLDKQEAENKASLIEERAKWDRDQFEKRFADMGVRLDNAFALAQNHTHTVDVKCDKLIESVNALAIQVGKLETIINERIPKQ